MEMALEEERKEVDGKNDDEGIDIEDGNIERSEGEDGVGNNDDVEEEDDDDDAEEKEKKDLTNSDGVEFDLGILTLFDTTPLSLERVEQSPETRNEYFREMATANMNLLLQRLCEVAREQNSISRVKLPPPTTKLPRQKPAPQPRPETRWEKFAKEKGIQKRKRERMVWDEASQTFKPRWGYNRMEDPEHSDWVVELKDGDDPTEDKFRKIREEKKLRILKNKQNMLRNKERGLDEAPMGVAESNILGSNKKVGRGKKRTQELLDAIQVSTSKPGGADGQDATPALKGKRRKFEPSEKTAHLERDKAILSTVLGKPISSSKSANARPQAKGKKAKR